MKRERWPTDVNGLPIKPNPECYEVCPRRSPRTNEHHLAFERRHYKSSLERAFRLSPEMLVEMCQCKHADLHATYSEPDKPSVNAMRGVVQGLIKPMTEFQAGVELQVRSRDAGQSNA